ncbi:FMN-binding negative transcriptional regulator [Mesorhizobium sp. M1312]|uniref:FMN-binding negative transcriptional regulator n=1 Tax=unclassified Mesorhizobium TaxID=325217 RepID=UPI0033375728
MSMGGSQSTTTQRYVRRNVAKATHKHEAGQLDRWKMGDAPRDSIDSMVKAIVALGIEITRLFGKTKLNQNKEPRDIRGAGEKLISQGETEVGRAMLQH